MYPKFFIYNNNNNKNSVLSVCQWCMIQYKLLKYTVLRFGLMVNNFNQPMDERLEYQIILASIKSTSGYITSNFCNALALT